MRKVRRWLHQIYRSSGSGSNAAELEARGNGLVFVVPDPENPVPVSVAHGWWPPDRVPHAASPTWVTVEKPRADLP